jgi:hypothetical protein
MDRPCTPSPVSKAAIPATDQGGTPRAIGGCMIRIAVLVVIASACGDPVRSALDGNNAGSDVIPPPDGGPRGPSVIVQTSGGGTASSAGFQVRVRIGAPQPSGEASSAGSRVRLGPFAGR